jgi:hypothetical protein
MNKLTGRSSRRVSSVSKSSYRPVGAPFPLAPGRPRSDWLYGQRMSKNFRSVQYQPEGQVNDPWGDVYSFAKKAGLGALAKKFGERALFNPRARFGGEVQ